MASLAEELAKLASPTPIFKDPEDQIDDTTSAKVEASYEEDQHDITQSSKLRRQTASSLAETDVKYAGKRVSRKILKTSTDESDAEVDEEAVDALEKIIDVDDNDKSDSSDNDVDMAGDDNADNSDQNNSDDEAIDDEELTAFRSKLSLSTPKDQGEGFSFVDDGDYSKYADVYEVEGGDDSEDDSEDDDEDDEKEDEEEEESNGEDENERKGSGSKNDDIDKFSKSSLLEEVEKGKAAKAQLTLWDNLLEGRIKVQKVASIVNQLPQPATWEKFVEKGGDNFVKSVTEVQSVLKKLLDELIRVQTLLLLQNPETKSVVEGTNTNKKKKASCDNDDEEITSESEEEPEDASPDKHSINQHLKRKLKMTDYPEFLSKRHKAFTVYRNETVHKWNDRTRLASGKIKGKSFSALEQSALKQIDQILRDKDRLIRRTQFNRSGQRVLGTEEKVSEENQRFAEDDAESKEAVKEDADNSYCTEVFDDTDFYHQLLRELIERKTSEINDPIAISRQWLEIEKLRSKVKRKKVDTRASKGRKIRYNVHSKLLNFMAAVDNSPWTDESKNDLYKSLFGKKFKSNSMEQSDSSTAER